MASTSKMKYLLYYRNLANLFSRHLTKWKVNDILCNYSALQAKGQVTEIAENGHGKDMVMVHIGNGILPVGQAFPVPHFPEKPADKGSQGRQK